MVVVAVEGFLGSEMRMRMIECFAQGGELN